MGVSAVVHASRSLLHIAGNLYQQNVDGHHVDAMVAHHSTEKFQLQLKLVELQDKNTQHEVRWTWARLALRPLMAVSSVG
eukprot:9473863-Pyramimonas_sp.AAC.4